MPVHSCNRRALLRTASLGAVGSLAGCLDSLSGDRSADRSPPPFGPLETDWPMLGRDPSNTGYSPVAAGPDGEPIVEWEVRPGRNGPPQVAVADDLLVVAGDDSVVAYDLERGERRWSVDADDPGAVALDSKRCYLRSRPSRLRAVGQDDGTARWSVDAEAAVTAPVVSNGTVYVGDGTGRVRAIDTDSAETRWTVAVGDRVSGPVATDGTHVVAIARDAVVVLGSDEGTSRWREALPCCDPPAPILEDSVVYTLRHALRAWDVASGAELWRYDPQGSDPSGPTLDDGRVYLGQLGLDAIDRDSGDRQWRATEGIRSLSSRPIAGSETVYVPSGDRHDSVTAVDADEGTVRWTKRIGDAVGTLVVAGNRLLVGTGTGELYSLVGPDDRDE